MVNGYEGILQKTCLNMEMSNLDTITEVKNFSY